MNDTRSTIRVGGGDLDSECDYAWQVFDRPPVGRIVSSARLRCRRGTLIAQECRRVLRVRDNQTTRRIFSNECSDAEDHVGAAAIARHNRVVGRSFVATVLGGHRSRVRPNAAYQRGTLPKTKNQHDRKGRCSKHVMLAVGKARNTPVTTIHRTSRMSDHLSCESCRRTREGGIFPAGRGKIPYRLPVIIDYRVESN